MYMPFPIFFMRDRARSKILLGGNNRSILLEIGENNQQCVSVAWSTHNHTSSKTKESVVNCLFFFLRTRFFTTFLLSFLNFAPLFRAVYDLEPDLPTLQSWTINYLSYVRHFQPHTLSGSIVLVNPQTQMRSSSETASVCHNPPRTSNTFAKLRSTFLLSTTMIVTTQSLNSIMTPSLSLSTCTPYNLSPFFSSQS